MNQEPELDSARQAEALSAKQRLEEAIRGYLDVYQRHEDDCLTNGVLTAWYLVTEEQDVITRKSANTRVVRDLQSPTVTMGLIAYSDEKYRARVRNS